MPGLVQPPAISVAFLRDKLARIQEQARLASPPQAAPMSAIRSLDPTTTQVEEYTLAIQAWLGTLTPSQRTRAFALAEVGKLSGISGRHGRSPGTSWLGQAARKAGLIPSRDWTRAGRNRRYWRLPG